MSELLKLSGLKGGYKKGVDILLGIDMAVNEGEAVGIIGLNGSGKSTLGKAIMNMLPFREGEVFFDNERITTLITCEISRRGIGIMQQGGLVFPSLSAWENLQLAKQSFEASTGFWKERYSQLKDIIPLLQLPERELRHAMSDRLSGGQKHQLSLAMTLSTCPQLVILDEPSAGLSPIAINDMYSILHAIRECFGVSIVLIEQNILKAVDFCDRCLLLQQGLVHKEIKRHDLQAINDIIFK